MHVYIPLKKTFLPCSLTLLLRPVSASAELHVCEIILPASFLMNFLFLCKLLPSSLCISYVLSFIFL